MRRLTLLIICLCFLTSCKGEESALAQANLFRAELLSKGGCAFTVDIQADFGQGIHSFSVACDSDARGVVTMEVLSPETIAGICATVDGDTGKLQYDGLSLTFGMLAHDSISPVSAPGLLADCWMSEFVLSAGTEGECYRASYEKKISDKVLLLDTYFENGVPISAEICYNNMKIIHMEISDFCYH